MRGVAALRELLAAHPKADLRVLVVWEPVLEGDTGPPSGTFRDPRVVELWDPALALSARAMARYAADLAAAGRPPPRPDQIAWDFIAFYPAGQRWEDPFPEPAWHGEPVVRALPGSPVEAALVR